MYVFSMIIKIREETNGQFPITPLVAAVLNAVTNFVFSLLGSLILGKVGRKTILIVGTIGMAVTNAVVGAGLIYEWYITAYIFMLLYCVIFSMGQGNVTFLYVAEVTVD
jgi:MFS family permease